MEITFSKCVESFTYVGVALSTDNTYVRKMRKKNILYKVINIKYYATLPKGQLLNKHLLSFKSSPYFGSDSRHSFQDFFPGCA